MVSNVVEVHPQATSEVGRYDSGNAVGDDRPSDGSTATTVNQNRNTDGG